MRVLLATWGSSGDFYPFLALGSTLRARGHAVTLVGDPRWAARTREAGLGFRAAFAAELPDPFLAYPEIMTTHRLGLTSLRLLVEKAIAPVLASTLRVLLAEASAHDLLVAHHFVFPAAIAHELTGLPWVTVTLAPGVTPSAEAMPAGSLFGSPSGPLWRGVRRGLWQIGRHLAARVVDPPLNDFRRLLGLAPQRDQMFSARSPGLNLHLYSPSFAPKPADWDERQCLTGFCFLAEEHAYQPPSRLAQFLATGAPPWLFTLGTTIVQQPGPFFQEAIRAVRDTPQRALLLTGKTAPAPTDLPPNVCAVDYVPHDWLMPRCAAVAHQCGSGTLAQALRAGIPSVACPRAFDQPNNAARLRDLGVAVLLPKAQQSGPHFRAAFQRISTRPFVQRAQRLGERIRAEDGNVTACRMLEKLLY